MEYRNVNFATGRNGAKLKIDYYQKDFADSPDRLAFIDSKMFGVPFQGYDYYLNGKGGMKGVLAKVFTLFNQTGDDMNQACLVTYLSESLFYLKLYYQILFLLIRLMITQLKQQSIITE